MNKNNINTGNIDEVVKKLQDEAARIVNNVNSLENQQFAESLLNAIEGIEPSTKNQMLLVACKQKQEELAKQREIFNSNHIKKPINMSGDVKPSAVPLAKNTKGISKKTKIIIISAAAAAVVIGTTIGIVACNVQKNKMYSPDNIRLSNVNKQNVSASGTQYTIKLFGEISNSSTLALMAYEFDFVIDISVTSRFEGGVSLSGQLDPGNKSNWSVTFNTDNQALYENTWAHLPFKYRVRFLAYGDGYSKSFTDSSYIVI